MNQNYEVNLTDVFPWYSQGEAIQYEIEQANSIPWVNIDSSSSYLTINTTNVASGTYAFNIVYKVIDNSYTRTITVVVQSCNISNWVKLNDAYDECLEWDTGYILNSSLWTEPS